MVAIVNGESQYEKAARRRRGFVTLDDLTLHIDEIEKQLKRLKDVRAVMSLSNQRSLKIDGVTKLERALPEIDTYSLNLRKALIDNDLV